MHNCSCMFYHIASIMQYPSCMRVYVCWMLHISSIMHNVSWIKIHNLCFMIHDVLCMRVQTWWKEHKGSWIKIYNLGFMIHYAISIIHHLLCMDPLVTSTMHNVWWGLIHATWRLMLLQDAWVIRHDSLSIVHWVLATNAVGWC